MLIRFYKSPQPLALFTIPLVSAVLCAGAFFFNTNFFPEAAAGMPFWHWLQKYSLLPGRIVLIGIVWVFISFQAIYFNRIIIKYEVLYKPSNLPGLIYVCMAGFIPAFIGFHPLIFVNTILLFVTDKILRLYKHPSPITMNYDIGVWISIAAFFYLPSVLYVLFFFISLSMLRPFLVREWITGLLGFITPWFFMAIVSVLKNDFSLPGLFSPEKLNSLFHINPNHQQEMMVAVSGFGVLLLLALFKLRLNFNKNIIRMRNFQLVFLAYLVISLCISVFVFEKSLFAYSCIAAPAAVFISYYFLTLKKAWYFELLFILLASIIIYNNVLHS